MTAAGLVLSVYSRRKKRFNIYAVDSRFRRMYNRKQKVRCFVSDMRNRIIAESVESLRHEGLRFSVDTLADKLKISKKTVYRYFPDKQTLAVALYEKYFSDAAAKAEELSRQGTESSRRELMDLYYDSKIMTREGIFNKYKLNQTIRGFVREKSDGLWDIFASSFPRGTSEEEKKALRVIVDGSFEKLCASEISPDIVTERLAKLLW